MPMAVHPRASGEHRNSSTRAAMSTGSSPRERGTRVQNFFNEFVRRFIPARAGNTVHVVKVHPYSPVHPRASGEHATISYGFVSIVGSSPRERGTHRGAGQRRRRRRFIPARAGNTTRPVVRGTLIPVHPRASGEHCIQFRVGVSQFGSSPRERGTLWRQVRRSGNGRFIPARAGNTPCIPQWQRGAAVHPRASGEHLGMASIIAAYIGSSPRERGTPLHFEHAHHVDRFIPARAGNTPTSAPRTSHSAVHPRASGEHVGFGLGFESVGGSSPRERGTPGVGR